MVFLIVIIIGNIVNSTMSSIFVECPYPRIAANTGASAGIGINCVRKRNGKSKEYIVLF